MTNENVFIAENQRLDIDEQKKNDISDFIRSCNDLQDFIKKLKEENLIWYFIGPLRKDEEIRKQVSSKWKKDLQEFEQSVDKTYATLKLSLPSPSFLVYPTDDNVFNVRFENEGKSIEVSNILKASDEGKVYHISLGKNSQVTACKKNGNERHYDLAGSGLCEMTINWQARDSKGHSINCSMVVEIDSSGIKRMVNKPKFGGVTSSEEILKLIEQNKEVFINGKTLYQAFIEMGKSMSRQEEEVFTKDSPQQGSSGYSSPSSRRSSFSEVNDEGFGITDEYIDDGYDEQEMHGNYEKKYEQKGLEDEVDEIIDDIEELGKGEETLAQYYAKQLEDSKLEIEKLQYQLKEKESALTHTQEELKSVKKSLEQLQQQTMTQTKVKYESKGTSMQQNGVQDQGTQSVDKSSSKIVHGLRQENKNLARDNLTTSEQLRQRVGEISELKKNLKQLQEDNIQLKQKVAKNKGVDASSSTDQKEIREMEVQTDLQMKNSRDLYDEEGKYVRTELSNPNVVPAEVQEKSTPKSVK